MQVLNEMMVINRKIVPSSLIKKLEGKFEK